MFSPDDLLLIKGAPSLRRKFLDLEISQTSKLYYQDLFEELTQQYPQFRYFPVLSDEPETSDWQGERGFVHEAAIRIYDNDFRNHKAYLCGPPPMIEAAIRGLMRGRLFERDIHIEKFLSAADAANQATRSPLFRNI